MPRLAHPITIGWTSLLITVVTLTAPARAVIYGEKMDDDPRLDAVCAVSRATSLGIKVGVGEPKHQHSWPGCGVLISPRHVITARHLLPKNPKVMERVAMAVRFRRHEDGSLGSTTKPADSYTQVRVMRWFVPKQGDVALGVLEREVTHIEPMPMLWDVPQDQPFKGMIAGWGSENPVIGKGHPRLGLRAGPNTLMRRGDNILILQFPTERKETGKNKEGQPIIQNVAKDEGVAMPNMHDSGGAMIAVSPDGKLGLVGIIATYRLGTWLGQYVDDEDFPLKDWATTEPE